MLVPFTWKVTGWFMVGWSPEFPAGEARPLHYFGEDLVAYRDEAGELHVLEGHCKHLGAHIGHGGKVVGDCVECPFHGWRWGPTAPTDTSPISRTGPTRSCGCGCIPVREQYDCVFIWHHPEGKEPQWEMPDIFHKFPQFETDPAAYYRAVPGVLPARRARTGASADRGRERPRQCAFRVRAPCHGDAAGAGLEDRRPGMAVHRRLAGRPQRQSGRSRVAIPQPPVRARAARSACSRAPRITG